MRHVVLIITMLLASINLYAIPADGVLRNVIQLDGTLLALRQYGDEYFHFLMTKDGLIVKETKEGGYYYAIIKEGRMLPSTILAHNPDMRSELENRFVWKRVKQNYDVCILDSLKETHRRMIQSANNRRLQTSHRALGVPTQYIGKKKGLVILVDFPNLTMKSETANSDHQRMFNEVGYSENYHVGSVHDYFYDQSYEQFDLTFDVIGPVTVTNNYGYYGSDDLNGYHDINVREMIVEACQLADELVNYQDYDWDNDGEVDQVFIIYAGYGQATGGPATTIWPHESHLTEELVLDGVKISQYACSNEIYKGSVNDKDMLMGIGTACHEFSHCLGLPDLYDTDYSGAYGMSYWSLMNSGSYSGPNGVGEIPYGYSAFERWFSGWLEFTELNTSQEIKELPCLEKVPVAYKIINDGNSNEFFTIENHQPHKWFSYISRYSGMHGLLITHIDFDKNAWQSNRVNPSPRHQRMSPIVADNNYTLSHDGLACDLFAGLGNITELTNSSHVDYGGKLFNKNTDGSYNMNKSILDIKEEDGLISFNVIFKDEIPTPYALDASDITHNSFKARWISSNENIESYTMELEIIRSIKPFVTETIIIDKITQSEYLVENIEAHSCNYRVRANKGDLHTEWSNVIRVSLSKSDGIKPLNTEERTTEIPIYSLDGIKRDTPQKGSLYIRNGKTYIKK